MISDDGLRAAPPPGTVPDTDLTRRTRRMKDDERVLVTGGTGFIAGHSIVQALNAGWRVRTTVRDLAREPALRAVIGDHAPLERLEVVAADLNADAGWLEAATDCPGWPDSAGRW